MFVPQADQNWHNCVPITCFCKDSVNFPSFLFLQRKRDLKDSDSTHFSAKNRISLVAQVVITTAESKNQVFCSFSPKNSWNCQDAVLYCKIDHIFCENYWLFVYFYESQSIEFPLEGFAFVSKNHKILVSTWFQNVILFAYQKISVFQWFSV